MSEETSFTIGSNTYSVSTRTVTVRCAAGHEQTRKVSTSGEYCDLVFTLGDGRTIKFEYLCYECVAKVLEPFRMVEVKPT